MTTLFHLTPAAAWQAARARGAYAGDSLATEGFIHCSLAHQVVEVLNRLFRGRADLVLLVLDDTALRAAVRFENLEGGTEQYPHLYGELNLDAIIDVRPLVPSADGSFSLSPDELAG